MELNLNLNTQVEVTLTAFGAEWFNKFTKKYYSRGIYEPKQYLEDEVMRISLWGLMQAFGDSIHMGMLEVPFKDNNIKVVVNT